MSRMLTRTVLAGAAALGIGLGTLSVFPMNTVRIATAASLIQTATAPFEPGPRERAELPRPPAAPDRCLLGHLVSVHGSEAEAGDQGRQLLGRLCNLLRLRLHVLHLSAHFFGRSRDLFGRGGLLL